MAETLVKLGVDIKIKQRRAHWTFSIRDRITFHNGMKVDAEAIKQSIEQTMKHKDCIAWPLKQVHLRQFSAGTLTLQVSR